EYHSGKSDNEGLCSTAPVLPQSQAQVARAIGGGVKLFSPQPSPPLGTEERRSNCDVLPIASANVRRHLNSNPKIQILSSEIAAREDAPPYQSNIQLPMADGQYPNT